MDNSATEKISSDVVPYILLNSFSGEHFQAFHQMIEAAFKVLLVEDNKKLADSARDALVSDETSPKYDIVVVSRGDEALVVVEDCEFDLVLLGVSLPNPDSLEVMKSLRTRSRDIPIVILTQERDRTFATQAIQSGARDCLGGDEVTAPLLQRVARYAIERYRIQRRNPELWIAARSPVGRQ